MVLAWDATILSTYLSMNAPELQFPHVPFIICVGTKFSPSDQGEGGSGFEFLSESLSHTSLFESLSHASLTFIRCKVLFDNTQCKLAPKFRMEQPVLQHRGR